MSVMTVRGASFSKNSRVEFWSISCSLVNPRSIGSSVRSVLSALTLWGLALSEVLDDQIQELDAPVRGVIDPATAFKAHCGLCHPPALVLASDERISGHAHVIEEDKPLRATRNEVHVLDGHALALGGHHEGAEVLVAWSGGVGVDERVQVVRRDAGADELLLPVDEVVIAITNAACLQRSQVRAGVGLGEYLPGDGVALEYLRQIALLLLVGAVNEDSRRANDQTEVAKGWDVVPRQLLVDHDGVVGCEAATSELLGPCRR